MNFKKIALMASAAMLADSAQAAIQIFDLTGTITSSTDYTVSGGGVISQDNLYAGTSFSGQISYDPDTPPSSSAGFQDIYFNAVSLSFASAAGSASGVGYINRLHGYFSNGQDSLSFVSFTSGAYSLTQIGAATPGSSVGAPLPTDLSGQTFSFSAEGTAITGLDFHKTLVGTLIFNATAVPEPATWATMIGGFGLVGAAMRRRRAVAAA